MGLLSSTVSLTRYRVDGKVENPLMENIARGLREKTLSDIDSEPLDKAVGWTSFGSPFHPDFEGNSFVIGTQFLFSLRIDKKSIPAKVVKKHLDMEIARRLKETGREHLSRNEKQAAKEHVLNVLSLRIPATPSIYDLLWSYEESVLWFFSTQKSANEELETLFTKSFGLTLIRLFPYTIAELSAGLSEKEREALSGLEQSRFTE